MNQALIEQIESLLKLDQQGSLVPHGIGGMARELFTRTLVELKRKVQPMNDDEIMELIRQNFPWRDYPRLFDELTYETTPNSLIPQATVTAPSFLAERFVRAVEEHISTRDAALLEEVRQEIVVVISFIGRDLGSDRLPETARQLMERFVKLHEKIPVTPSKPK